MKGYWTTSSLTCEDGAIRSIKIFLLLFLFCLPSAALAKPGAKDAATARAKEFFKQGAQAYRLANFKEALGFFEEAMKLSPRPSVILNLAQCHRQLDNHKKSLFFYKLYLTEWARLNSKKEERLQFHAEVNKYINELQGKLEALKKPEPIAPKPEPKAPLHPGVLQGNARTAPSPGGAPHVQQPVVV